MSCTMGTNHDYRHFESKKTVFIAANEPSTKTGVCVKCNNYIKGEKDVK